MIEFRLFGINVHVHPLHWVVLALFGGALQALNDPSLWLNVALFVLAGFLSILVHEFGHALTIKKYGLPTEIHLVAFGGLATLPPSKISRKESFLIVAAGPAIQILLGVLAWAILAYGGLPDTQISNFFYFLMVVSIFWAVLNCVPVYPLDGGQMLMAILGPSREKTTYLTGVITSLILIVLAMKYTGSFIAPVFFALFAYENYQRYTAAKSHR